MTDEPNTLATKPRVYIDTSVISAMLDAARPDRQQQKRAFWERAAEFAAVTSELTRDELSGTPDTHRRADLLALLARVGVGPVTPPMLALARTYVDRGIFPQRFEADGVHVAAAVHLGCPTLVSWNFRHLVNRRRRAAVNSANQALGLPALDIISPPEY